MRVDAPHPGGAGRPGAKPWSALRRGGRFRLLGVLLLLAQDQAQHDRGDRRAGHAAEHRGRPERERRERAGHHAEPDADGQRHADDRGRARRQPAAADDVHAGEQDRAERRERDAAEHRRGDGRKHGAQLRAEAAQHDHAAGDGDHIAARHPAQAAQADIGAAGDGRHHVEQRGEDARHALRQDAAAGLLVGGETALRQHGGGGLVAHQLDQRDEREHRDGDRRPQLKVDAKVQRLRHAHPALRADGGQVELAEQGGDGRHDDDGDERGRLGEEVLPAVVVEQQHDDDRAEREHQVDRVAVVGRAGAARAVVDADAEQAQAQRHHDRAGDIRLKQVGELLVERRPQHDRHHAADQARAGERVQPVLHAQRDAGRHEHKAVLQADGQPRPDRPHAQRLDDGRNAGDKQAARDQDRDLRRAEPDAAPDEQRHRQDVENQDENVLQAERNRLLDRGAFVEPIANGNLFHVKSHPFLVLCIHSEFPRRHNRLYRNPAPGEKAL